MADEDVAVEVTEEVAAPEVVDAPEASEAEAPSKSVHDAVERAVERARSEGGQPRGPDGKFAPKDAMEAPTEAVEADPEPVAELVPELAPEVAERMPAELRAMWKDIPAAAREPVERMVRGFADRYAPIQRYDDMARQGGTTLAAALENYTGIEQELRANPLQGLDRICRNFGSDLKSVAAHVMGQPAPERDQVIDGLNAKIAALEKNMGGVTQRFEQQHQKETGAMVEAFFAANPRANDLSLPSLRFNIPALVQRGYSLEEAYELADKANPVPPPPPPPSPPAAGKAKISMQGAPGSSPAPVRTASKSVSEAVARAVTRAQASL
jgi:hypothetical protein